MDRDDLLRPECAEVLDELFALMRWMQTHGLEYSSWYGRLGAWPSAWEWINRGQDYEPWPGNPDEIRVPWFLLWEIAWLATHARLTRGGCVLDMGGSASLFACLLAARGMEVHTIELNNKLVAHTWRLAQRTGWRLHARTMDMRHPEFPQGTFDHVFSVCVLEHLPVSGRVACNRQVRRLLRPGGTAGFTFDYGNPQAFARLDTPRDVRRQIVEPSGLALDPAHEFADNGKRYLVAPQYFGFGRATAGFARTYAWLRGEVHRWRPAARDARYTFGAVVMGKEGGGSRSEPQSPSPRE